MLKRRLAILLALFAAMCALPGCVSLQQHDPLQVAVADVESIPNEGMELRMLVKLRVQNPNDAPVDYNGVALQLTVQGKTFATGVSDTAGSVPRFGESVIDVPVTASAFRMARQVLALAEKAGTPGKITYEMNGKLHSTGFGSIRFRDKGDFELPNKR